MRISRFGLPSAPPTTLRNITSRKPRPRHHQGTGQCWSGTTRANGIKLGRGNRKDGKASADEKRWGMSTAAMEKKIKALHRSGMGMLRIGRELGVGTGFVQRVISADGR